MSIGGCAGTRYGCCSDGKTSKRDASGSNCPEILFLLLLLNANLARFYLVM